MNGMQLHSPQLTTRPILAPAASPNPPHPPPHHQSKPQQTQITYWDAYDCQAIRVLEGSSTGQINTVVTSPDGESLVTSGADKMVKLWGYDDGLCHGVGVAHSGVVTGLQVSPDKSRIVSVGAEGGIFVWSYAQPPPVEGGAGAVV